MFEIVGQAGVFPAIHPNSAKMTLGGAIGWSCFFQNTRAALPMPDGFSGALLSHEGARVLQGYDAHVFGTRAVLSTSLGPPASGDRQGVHEQSFERHDL